MTNQNKLVKDMFDIINNDLYAWFCVWGPPRTGKSNLCLLLSYWVYKDWDDVLNSIVFNLNGLLYKLENGEPRLYPTYNKLHNRIPLLVLDDYGVHCNKAKTQYERGWDLFKGGFDALGTMLGILIANMVSPAEATQQLADKYTHEIFVHRRGCAKYDKVHQEQDFSSWRARQKKEWLLEFTFNEIPLDVFKQYDEMRTGLAKEVLFNINEVIAVNEVETILKRLQKPDIKLLNLLNSKGPTYKLAIEKELHDETDDCLTRMKAKGLIVPKREGVNYYKYVLTDLGFNALEALNNKQG